MITPKQLNKLPTRLQMSLCNYTAVKNDIVQYTTSKDGILKFIDVKVFNSLLKRVGK